MLANRETDRLTQYDTQTYADRNISRRYQEEDEVTTEMETQSTETSTIKCGLIIHGDKLVIISRVASI